MAVEKSDIEGLIAKARSDSPGTVGAGGALIFIGALTLELFARAAEPLWTLVVLCVAVSISAGVIILVKYPSRWRQFLWRPILATGLLVSVLAIAVQTQRSLLIRLALASFGAAGIGYVVGRPKLIVADGWLRLDPSEKRVNIGKVSGMMAIIGLAFLTMMFLVRYREKWPDLLEGLVVFDFGMMFLGVFALGVWAKEPVHTRRLTGRTLSAAIFGVVLWVGSLFLVTGMRAPGESTIATVEWVIWVLGLVAVFRYLETR